jgi:hypothetical protein
MFSDFEIQKFQKTSNIDKVINANTTYKFIVDKVFISKSFIVQNIN